MSEEPYRPALPNYSAPQELLDEHAEMAEEEAEPDAFEDKARSKQVAARQSDYQLRRFQRADGRGEGEDESYADRMRLAELQREEEKVRRHKEQL